MPVYRIRTEHMRKPSGSRSETLMTTHRREEEDYLPAFQVGELLPINHQGFRVDMKNGRELWLIPASDEKVRIEVAKWLEARIGRIGYFAIKGTKFRLIGASPERIGLLAFGSTSNEIGRAKGTMRPRGPLAAGRGPSKLSALAGRS